MANKPTKTTKPQAKNKANQYDDPTHNYREYWDGRDYEQAAEELMIDRILKGRNFKNAVDVGGGYGRLSVYLTKFADSVTLAEPSSQQLDIAKDFLKDKPEVRAVLAQAEDLPFDDESFDLAMVVRVIHHLPNPVPAFEEIHRVLQKDGMFLMEFANYANFKNRVKHVTKLKKLPQDPVDIRTGLQRTGKDDIPFVNHNPKTVKRQLMQVGFELVDQLSVSNFRSAKLKKHLSKETLIKMEKATQRPLAKSHFGPSTVY